MISDNFSILECEILTLFNKGFKTFDSISEQCSLSNSTLLTNLENLVSKGILKFNKVSKEYEYQTPLNKETIILDGNLLLPVTILKFPDKGIMYVSRGKWYELPIDFDVRRIIWNVKTDAKTNSTLVDIIRTSVLKERKSKIQQLPDYENLRKKIVPYNDKLLFIIDTIGEAITEITLIIKIPVYIDGDISIEHRGFTVKTEIATNELLTELRASKETRNFENIVINRMYNFSDFIFSRNEIPINLIDKKLTFCKIVSVKRGYNIEYFELGQTGTNKKIKVDEYEDPNEAIDEIRSLFSGFAKMCLLDAGLVYEETE